MVACAPFHFKVAIVLTGVATLIVFIIMCIAYVHPYSKTKNFEESECTVISHYIKIMKDKECNCVESEGSLSETYCDYGDFECLKIYVSFLDTHSRNRTALLYLSDTSFAQDNDCSYPVCDTYDPAYIYSGTGSYTEDRDYVKFRDEYTKPGTSFHCHYNPEKAEAVIQRNVTKKEVISSTVGTIVAGTILMVLIALACVRWKRNQSEYS